MEILEAGTMYPQIRQADYISLVSNLLITKSLCISRQTLLKQQGTCQNTLGPLTELYEPVLCNYDPAILLNHI